MSERVQGFEEFEKWIQEQAEKLEDMCTRICASTMSTDQRVEAFSKVVTMLYEKGWDAGQFALNSELGIAANEAAKAARLETFMHHIITQDMVPLPLEKLRAWAKELQG